MITKLSVSMICFFFFFKQKTAYEMRISDWSSDVCSSDLLEKADIASEIHIPAGTTASISTGLTIAVPAGLEAQARASSSLPDGLLEIGRASCRERVCQYV